MKKIWGFLLVVIIATAGCGKEKDCPPVTIAAPANEVANLKAYLDANNITATADSRGFFYTITNAGSNEKPTVCKNITVSYVGKLTNGQTFDSNPNATFSLSGVILGWQEGIPLIGTGGSIVLYVPPSLAYGSAGYLSIPGNANLIFTVGLKGIQ
jgi:FKBP-type peptidyl-prolyl cis-trans isomerase